MYKRNTDKVIVVSREESIAYTLETWKVSRGESRFLNELVQQAKRLSLCLLSEEMVNIIYDNAICELPEGVNTELICRWIELFESDFKLKSIVLMRDFQTGFVKKILLSVPATELPCEANTLLFMKSIESAKLKKGTLNVA